MPLLRNFNRVQPKRKIVKDELFEFADTGKGDKVAILPSDDEPLVVRLKDPEIVIADPVFQPKADKVFSQTPKAGTMVARGTTVNLVLVARDAGKVGMLDKAHEALADAKLVEVYDQFVKDDPKIQAAAEKYARGEDVTEDEKDLVRAKFEAEGIQLDEANTGRNFDAGMNALAGAVQFAGEGGRVQ
mgnify:CR=1 FL=1